MYPPMNDSGEADLTTSPESLIQKTQNVALVLKCGGLWFVGGKFGITWKLMQGVVQPRATLRGKCHIKLNVAEKDLMKKAAAAAEEDDDENEENVGIDVEDSDDEEETVAEKDEPEETQETQEVVEPEPPKKKKVVRRKKTVAAEDS